MKKSAFPTVSALHGTSSSRPWTRRAKTARAFTEFEEIEPLNHEIELRNAVQDLVNQLSTAQERWWSVNERAREYDNAQRAVAAAIAEGDRIQAERLVARQRTSAIIQGYRTRDAAFRIFRNEKLERYKTLFDLSGAVRVAGRQRLRLRDRVAGHHRGKELQGQDHCVPGLGCHQRRGTAVCRQQRR